MSALILCLCIAPACGEPRETDVPAFIAKDSAGVRVVDNYVAELPEGSWSISSEPEVVIGAVDEVDQNLYLVTRATRLDDARIVVGQFNEPVIRWYAGDGRYLAGAGRRGQGPGEFDRTFSTLWAMPGDSIATWEHAPRRMQVFDPNSNYVRSLVLELPPDLSPGSYPSLIGRSDSVFASYILPNREVGPLGVRVRDDFHFVTHRSDGTFLQRLVTLPGSEWVTVERPRTGSAAVSRSPTRPPFSRTARSALSPEGFYYGWPDTYEVAAYDFSGALVRIVRRDLANQPLSAEARSAYIADRRGPDGEPRVRQTPSLDDLPFPEMLPAFDRLVVDRQGWLWVRRYELPGESIASWSVFDPTGRWITDVPAPRAWRVLEIGPDYLLVLVRDELDVEYVVQHHLSRRD